MNFDELKKKWDNQAIEDFQIEVDLDQQQKVSSIIDAVRKVMKKDFFFQLTAFPILLLYPYLFQVSTPIMWFVILCYVIIMILPIRTLFRFYKESYQMEYSSLKSLNWFYYNYKFSIDLFKIYSYITSVLVVMFLGIVFLEKIAFDTEKNALAILGVLAGALLVYVLFCVWMIKWWINKFYSKPLAEIKNILDELES